MRTNAAFLTFSLAAAALALAGCGEPDAATADTTGESVTVEQEVVDDLEGTLAGDLEELARTAEAVVAEAETLDDGAAPPDASYCEEGVGTCEVCFGYAGTAASGTFSLETVNAPCGGEYSGRISASYTVKESALSGGWTLTDLRSGAYTVTGAGARRASVEVDGLRGSTAYDASLEITALQVDLLDYALDSFEAAMTYQGFGDHSWEITVSGDAGAVTGTAVIDGVLTCTVSGSMDAPELRCEH
jgi:hypothetical protein